MIRPLSPAYRTRGLRREAAINDKVALLEVIFGLNRLANANRLDVEAALSFLNTLPDDSDDHRAAREGRLSHAHHPSRRGAVRPG